MELKLKLNELKDRSLKYVSNEELESLITNMLDNIGSIDPDLRDGLIYPTFMRIINEGILTSNQYQNILEACLDDGHLFYKIGEINTDSVFTRSFSSLVVAGLLSKDGQSGFLSEIEFNYVYNRCVKYMREERDTRGFVEEKGWAHSIAHGADLLVSLVNHPKLSEQYFSEILQTLHNCLLKDATYIDDEDERLIFVIEALLEKGLDEKNLEEWIIHLLHDLELIFQDEGFSNKYFRTKFNISNFLKTLYFRIGFNYNLSKIRDLINQNLKKLHQKIYGS